MSSRYLVASTLFVVAALISCRLSPDSTETAGLQDETLASFDPALDYFPEKVVFEYASNVTVEYHRSFKLLTVAPQHQRWHFRYLLLQRGAPRPSGYPEAIVIEAPVRTYTIEVFGGLQQFLEPLGVEGGLVALSGKSGAFLTMPRIRHAIEQGRVDEIGGGSTVNLEKLIELRPELILSDFVGASSSMFAVRRIGLTGFPLANRTERSPLSSAEWVKVLGILFNREKEANEIFDQIAERYEDLRARAEAAPGRPPTALPGRASGMWRERLIDRQLVQAAGGELVPEPRARWDYYHDHPHELILDQGFGADVWPFATPAWRSLQDLMDADSRLAKLQAVRSGRVYVIGSPPTRGVMNDYYGSAYVFPDRILADLVHILHPEILPDHQLRYFRVLDGTTPEKAN